MISKNDILKVAGLAKLKLSDQEVERLTSDLGQILAYVEKLNGLDLKDVVATSHASGGANVFREDRVELSHLQESILEQAPDHDGGAFRVPRIL